VAIGSLPFPFSPSAQASSPSTFLQEPVTAGARFYVGQIFLVIALGEVVQDPCPLKGTTWKVVRAPALIRPGSCPCLFANIWLPMR
jgi:hypothetical protein